MIYVRYWLRWYRTVQSERSRFKRAYWTTRNVWSNRRTVRL